MRRLLTGGLGAAVAIALWAAAAEAQEPPCESTPGRTAERLGGEVGGAHALHQTFGPGLALALLPSRYGWDLRIFDAAGADLSQMTPPLHGPNPRDLYGWHFRNADNTGPNEGSVNAPQNLRLFEFATDAAWAADPAAQRDGRGWLRIVDMGLADLEPGQQARMNYLQFNACLIWPSALDAPAPPDTTNLVTPELIEQFGACGLDAAFTLDPYLNTAELGGDFDGDGSLDVAAPVSRRADGKRAIAICRAGTWLDLVGLEGEMGELVPAYFESIDWWALHPATDPVGVGATGEPPPALHGDAIRIGKDDSSSALFLWTPEGYASYWQGD